MRGLNRTDDVAYLERLLVESRHIEVKKAAEAQLRAIALAKTVPRPNDLSPPRMPRRPLRRRTTARLDQAIPRRPPNSPRARTMAISSIAPTSDTRYLAGPSGANPSAPAQPHAQEGTHDADQDVRNQPHLSIALHHEAGDPADHAADDQGDYQIHSILLRGVDRPDLHSGLSKAGASRGRGSA